MAGGSAAAKGQTTTVFRPAAGPTLVSLPSIMARSTVTITVVPESRIWKSSSFSTYSGLKLTITAPSFSAAK